MRVPCWGVGRSFGLSARVAVGLPVSTRPWRGGVQPRVLPCLVFEGAPAPHTGRHHRRPWALVVDGRMPRIRSCDGLPSSKPPARTRLLVCEASSRSSRQPCAACVWGQQQQQGPHHSFRSWIRNRPANPVRTTPDTTTTGRLTPRVDRTAVCVERPASQQASPPFSDPKLQAASHSSSGTHARHHGGGEKKTTGGGGVEGGGGREEAAGAGGGAVRALGGPGGGLPAGAHRYAKQSKRPRSMEPHSWWQDVSIDRSVSWTDHSHPITHHQARWPAASSG